MMITMMGFSPLHAVITDSTHVDLYHTRVSPPIQEQYQYKRIPNNKDQNLNKQFTIHRLLHRFPPPPTIFPPTTITSPPKLTPELVDPHTLAPLQTVRSTNLFLIPSHVNQSPATANRNSMSHSADFPNMISGHWLCI